MAGDLVSHLLSDTQTNDAGEAFPIGKYDENLQKLAKFAREADERDLVQPTGDSSLLALLNPTRNTIGYLAVLKAYKNLTLKTRQLSPGQLDHTINFLATFDPIQARYMGPELREVLNWLASYYETSHDASVVPAVGAAILKLDPSSSTFTSTHLLFVRLCLAAGLPRQALPVLDKDIYNFPTEPVKGIDDTELCAAHDSSTFITRSSGISAAVSAADVQEYYLLGAQVYIGLRQWSRAKLFLELVLASPAAQVATPLMVEAYKKRILLGLLTNGYASSPKGMLDQQAFKAVSAISRAYETLAESFKNRDLQRLNAEVDTGIAVWSDDGNLGLVNQVAESLLRYRVIDLQKTYSALPVDRIAIHLSLSTDAAITLLNSMIRDGYIKATLSQSTATQSEETPSLVLRFLSHNPAHQPLGLNQESILQAKYQQIERLSKHVKEADRKLAISEEYVKFVRRNKRAEGAGAPGYEDPMEEGWEPNVDADEDMMADIH